jgi:hypothetical protein
MRNAALAELNFEKLLHYGRPPEERGQLTVATECTGYCVSCEKNGFLDDGEHRLDQMSHGADTDDFERAIRPLPEGGIKLPVAFLLESPGGYYGNGAPIAFEGITKQPPVNHYYWTPNQLSEWPSDPTTIVPKSYGPYFAYLLATHKLHYAYFTNIIKCSLAQRDVDKFKEYYVVADPNNRDSKIRTNCYNLFLSEEMKLVNPRIVFYFGTKAAKMGDYVRLCSLLPTTRFVTLYHPAARFVSPSQIVTQNDQRIQESLRDANAA